MKTQLENDYDDAFAALNTLDAAYVAYVSTNIADRRAYDAARDAYVDALKVDVGVNGPAPAAAYILALDAARSALVDANADLAAARDAVSKADRVVAAADAAYYAADEDDEDDALAALDDAWAAYDVAVRDALAAFRDAFAAISTLAAARDAYDAARNVRDALVDAACKE